MRALVTGGAGFIGSHLTDALLADGHRVRVVDCFTDFYDRDLKTGNVEQFRGNDRAEVIEADLRDADLAALLDGIDVVFHQAGQPGVRLSWGEGFGAYESLNVVATQRLLEAARAVPLRRFVFASSSSIYGNATRYPTTEADLPNPMSPYGVTKLAAEHLCGLYASNWGVPAVALRYFTVYGPRQRPDMAFHRIIRAALEQEPFPLYGTGEQIRDFTYVADVVRANLLAADADLAPGTVMNIAGGGAHRLSELIDLAGELTGHAVPLDRRPAQAGDVERTGGAIDKAQRLLGWSPATDVRAGLTAQVRWQQERMRT